MEGMKHLPLVWFESELAPCLVRDAGGVFAGAPASDTDPDPLKRPAEMPEIPENCQALDFVRSPAVLVTEVAEPIIAGNCLPLDACRHGFAFRDRSGQGAAV